MLYIKKILLEDGTDTDYSAFMGLHDYELSNGVVLTAKELRGRTDILGYSKGFEMLFKVHDLDAWLYNQLIGVAYTFEDNIIELGDEYKYALRFRDGDDFLYFHEVYKKYAVDEVLKVSYKGLVTVYTFRDGTSLGLVKKTMEMIVCGI